MHDTLVRSGTATIDRPTVDIAGLDALSVDADPAPVGDEFTLDVAVLVTATAVRRGDCPTNDGCGSSCATDNSACTSFVEDPA
jgi:FxLD family lantipeptide